MDDHEMRNAATIEGRYLRRFLALRVLSYLGVVNLCHSRHPIRSASAASSSRAGCYFIQYTPAVGSWHPLHSYTDRQTDTDTSKMVKLVYSHLVACNLV